MENLRKLLPGILLTILLSETVKADVIFPVTFILLPHFPAIILIELIVFALFTSLYLKRKDVSFGRITTGVLVANLISSGVGLIFPAFSDISILLTSTYLASVSVEFLVYDSIFKLRKLELLEISLLTNFASYLFIALMLLS